MAGSRRARLAALGILAGALLAGCGEAGIGPGEESGSASVLVTRDFGRSEVREFEVEGVGPSTTVIRALESGASVETSYGGGFVEAIDGFGAGGDESTLDWFYFVDGIEAEVGAADFTLAPGDRVWWDLRQWGTSMYVGSVVGSYPAPLSGGYRDAEWPVSLTCRTTAGICDLVRDAMADDGIELSGRTAGERIEVVVGEWDRVSASRPDLARSPSNSGVFARFTGRGDSLLLLDSSGEVVVEEERRAGLIASVGGSGKPPTWFVTGTDPAGVRAAAGLLAPDRLARSYAVAAVDGEAVRLPTDREAPNR